MATLAIVSKDKTKKSASKGQVAESTTETQEKVINEIVKNATILQILVKAFNIWYKKEHLYLVMCPPDNNVTLKEYLFKPVDFLSILEEFQERYRLYKYGYNVFIDGNIVYVMNKTTPNKINFETDYTYNFKIVSDAVNLDGNYPVIFDEAKGIIDYYIPAKAVRFAGHYNDDTFSTELNYDITESGNAITVSPETGAFTKLYLDYTASKNVSLEYQEDADFSGPLQVVMLTLSNTFLNFVPGDTLTLMEAPGGTNKTTLKWEGKVKRWAAQQVGFTRAAFIVAVGTVKEVDAESATEGNSSLKKAILGEEKKNGESTKSRWKQFVADTNAINNKIQGGMPDLINLNKISQIGDKVNKFADKVEKTVDNYVNKYANKVDQFVNNLPNLQNKVSNKILADVISSDIGNILPLDVRARLFTQFADNKGSTWDIISKEIAGPISLASNLGMTISDISSRFTSFASSGSSFESFTYSNITDRSIDSNLESERIKYKYYTYLDGFDDRVNKRLLYDMENKLDPYYKIFKNAINIEETDNIDEEKEENHRIFTDIIFFSIDNVEGKVNIKRHIDYTNISSFVEYLRRLYRNNLSKTKERELPVHSFTEIDTEDEREIEDYLDELDKKLEGFRDRLPKETEPLNEEPKEEKEEVMMLAST